MIDTQSGLRTQKKLMSVTLCGALFVIVWAAHLFIRPAYQPGDAVRIAATTALTLAFGLFVFLQFRLISTLDEYQRQLHTMALTIAFPVSMVAIFAFGFFLREGFLAEYDDPRDLAGMMVFVYLLGYLIARWRYR